MSLRRATTVLCGAFSTSFALAAAERTAATVELFHPIPLDVVKVVGRGLDIAAPLLSTAQIALGAVEFGRYIARSSRELARLRRKAAHWAEQASAEAAAPQPSGYARTRARIEAARLERASAIEGRRYWTALLDLGRDVGMQTVSAGAGFAGLAHRLFGLQGVNTGVAGAIGTWTAVGTGALHVGGALYLWDSARKAINAGQAVKSRLDDDYEAIRSCGADADRLAWLAGYQDKASGRLGLGKSHFAKAQGAETDAQARARRDEKYAEIASMAKADPAKLKTALELLSAVHDWLQFNEDQAIGKERALIANVSRKLVYGMALIVLGIALAVLPLVGAGRVAMFASRACGALINIAASIWTARASRLTAKSGSARHAIGAKPASSLERVIEAAVAVLKDRSAAGTLGRKLLKGLLREHGLDAGVIALLKEDATAVAQPPGAGEAPVIGRGETLLLTQLEGLLSGTDARDATGGKAVVGRQKALLEHAGPRVALAGNGSAAPDAFPAGPAPAPAQGEP